MKKSKSNTTKKQVMDFVDKEFSFTTSITRGKSSNRSGESHYHIFEIELQYVRYGSGAYFVKDRKYPLKEDSILIIHKGEVHNYIKGDSLAPMDRVYLAFNPSIFRNTQYTYKKLISHITECKKNFSHQVSFPPEESQRADLIISNITSEWENKKLHYREAIVNLLLELFIIIHRSFSFSASGTSTHKKIESTVQDKLISKVISYIDKNYRNPLHLATLSRHVFRSSYHLSHIFKDVTGFNFKEYLINKRIMKAKNLLESESDIKVISVAEDVGFSNLSTFNRDFKRLTGINPSEYRKFCTHFRKK
ncbi:MAG: AraC family transcriptional regulator [bacterium]|nr:AraC family transcriptional regulator [bacterium]